MGEDIKMKQFVISGINLIDGGALSVFHDCLDSLVNSVYLNDYKVTILVGNKSLFEKYGDKVTIIEFQKSKKSWLFRLYYEYFLFKKLSKKLNADVWLSLHDITPNVISKKRYVYCHNPSPFNKMSISEAKYGLKYYLFSKFYKYLYRINIKQNDGVIVQQNWIRNEFKKLYHHSNIIVARPSLPTISRSIGNYETNENIFIYPSYPRYYKNFQSVCEACKLLELRGITDFSLIVTVDGSENLYSRELVKKYSNISTIKFVGLLTRSDLYDIYCKAKCLIFMSKLETWGMPLIEFKATNKFIIAADLPYAHETIGDYDKAIFVDVDNPYRIAELMEKILLGYEINQDNRYENPEKPCAQDWNELLKLLLD